MRQQLGQRQRQDAIASHLDEHARASVAFLAQRYGVTCETVRRDLSLLEGLGLLHRVHGGAVRASLWGQLADPRPVLPPTTRLDAKAAVAQAAVDLLPPDGSCLILDAGTTAACVAAAISRERRLTVFTRAVTIAALLADHPNLTLHLLPGQVTGSAQAATGAATLTALDRLRVDSAVVGATSISHDRGLTAPDHDDAATRRAVVRCAGRAIVVADSSKFGAGGGSTFAALDEVDWLVTDAGISVADSRVLGAAGVAVIVAP